MPRVKERLNTATLRKVARVPGVHADGNGLVLRVQAVKDSDTTTASWALRYQLHGRAHWMGLGPFDLVSLAEARVRAQDARKLLLDGVDPISARKAERTQAQLEAARAISFEACAREYVATHEKSWRNAKHRAQWLSTLEAYAFPIIGKLPVGSIDTPQVLQVLRPIWNDKHETATRVRGRIEAILNFATIGGYRAEGLNPARWQGHLKHMLAKPTGAVKHHEAMPYVELPVFMGELRERPAVAARALEFAILTAARTGEVLGCTWAEIDLDAKLWIVPAERMKAGREHVVPLSPRAVEILEAMPTREGYVFPGQGDKPLSTMAFLMLLRRMKRDVTAHGFRSTFRDWAGDRSGFDRETVEFALAHGITDKAEAAYRRGTGLEKRTRLMTMWADYCQAPPSTTNNVVPLREASHAVA
ncbi:MAG: tyrosine-type recombinase/integrase [Rhizobiales bacterium]|nr:tyrosine-type recombinase/integrase [Hyphomicrobiales bacterium]OJY44290.1 MAG: hypothetical protein BGP08_08815 [Rhizobiales bacterium 64-17]